MQCSRFNLAGPESSGAVFITDTDLLWLAKSLAYESFSTLGRAAVAYCMVQRYLRWPGDTWRDKPFTDFVRAFSQPVNPKWAYPTPELMARYPQACAPKLLARRQRLEQAKWEDLNKDARQVALEFACGHLDNPVPAAVDFAAVGLVKRQGKKGITIGGNTFLNPDQTDMHWRNGVLVIDACTQLSIWS